MWKVSIYRNTKREYVGFRILVPAIDCGVIPLDNFSNYEDFYRFLEGLEEEDIVCFEIAHDIAPSKISPWLGIQRYYNSYLVEITIPRQVEYDGAEFLGQHFESFSFSVPLEFPLISSLFFLLYDEGIKYLDEDDSKQVCMAYYTLKALYESGKMRLGLFKFPGLKALFDGCCYFGGFISELNGVSEEDYIAYVREVYGKDKLPKVKLCDKDDKNL